MKLIRLLLLAVAAIQIQSSSALNAQDAQSPGTVTKSPDPAATLEYIHGAWETLTRSMTECHSLVDIKVTANPILYMPAETPAPPDVAALSEKCHVKIASLPQHIEKLGDVRPEQLPAAGLLYLPNPYVVPGGRFNEMYGWDSFFILLGLEADHREALAKGMVDNFLFEIEHYGAVLNANRTYYLTRSQPPFLTSMIRAVYENPASFPATPAGRTEARAWLEHAYTLAEKDYSTWTRQEHKAGTTGLARYFDYGSGPVPEMADDSTYYTDVIRWLVAHPSSSRRPVIPRQRHRPARCRRGRTASANELRRESRRGLHARMGRRLPPHKRFLPWRPRHARIGIRSEQSLRPILRSNTSLCPGVPQQPALSLRTRHAAPGSVARQTERFHALGSSRQGSQHRNPSLSLAAATRRLRGLRLHPRTSRPITRTSRRSIRSGPASQPAKRRKGRGQTESLRAQRRAVNEQHATPACSGTSPSGGLRRTGLALRALWPRAFATMQSVWRQSGTRRLTRASPMTAPSARNTTSSQEMRMCRSAQAIRKM